MKESIEIDVMVDGWVVDGSPAQGRGDGTYDPPEGPDVEDFEVTLRTHDKTLNITEFLPEDTLEMLKDAFIEANS